MKQAFFSFKKNFKILLLMSLMIVLPVYLIQEFIIQPRFPVDIESAYNPKIIWYLLSMWLISLFVYVYRIAVIKLSFITLETDTTSGVTSPNISELMDFSLRFWPKFIVTSLIYAISVALGFMIILLPGIAFLISYAYYQYVSVRTGLWGNKPLLLSSFYMRKSIGFAAGVAFGTIALRYAFSYGITYINDFIPNSWVCAAVTAALYTLFELFFSIIDFYISSYIVKTKLDFDMSVLTGKGSAGSNGNEGN